MVTPLGQRMVFQTSHSEATRVAHDIASQLQRDEAFKKILSDRMAGDAEMVRVIEKSEAMKAEERRERQRRQGSRRDRDGRGAEEDTLSDEPAIFAAGILDFMA